MLGAQIHEAGDSANAGPGQIKQDEVDLVVVVKFSGQRLKVPAFDNGATLNCAGDRLMQGAAHEGVVVSYDNAGQNTHGEIPPKE
jgi:hypothetical protein